MMMTTGNNISPPNNHKFRLGERPTDMKFHSLYSNPQIVYQCDELKRLMGTKDWSPILFRYGIRKDLVKASGINPRELLKQFTITKPLPIDQNKIDIAMNYKEVGIEDMDLDSFYKKMKPGIYVYDANIPKKVLERYEEFVPKELRTDYGYNILSQVPGMTTSYAYFGTDETGTGIHWDLFSSVGVNEMVAVYNTDGKDLVVDSCTKSELADCDRHTHSDWILWHPRYRDQILGTVFSVASGKRYLDWEEILRLDIPFCHIVERIGDIVVIPPGWLHQVGNKCEVKHSKYQAKIFGASLKLAWNILLPEQLEKTNAEYSLHQTIHKDTSYYVRSGSWNLLRTLSMQQEFTDSDKPNILYLYNALRYWFEENKIEQNNLTALFKEDNPTTLYVCSSCFTELFATLFICPRCNYYQLCHVCILLERGICHMEHYFPAFNEFVPYKEIAATLSSVEMLLHQWSLRPMPLTPKLTAFMAYKKILFTRSKHLLNLFFIECQKKQDLLNMTRGMKFVLTVGGDLLLLPQDSVPYQDHTAEIYSLTTIQTYQTKSIVRYLMKEIEEEDQYLLGVHNALSRFGITNELNFYSDLLLKNLSTIGDICCLVDNKQTSAEQDLRHVVHINMDQMNNAQMNTKRFSKKQKREKKNYCVSVVRFNTVADCLVRFYRQKMNKDLVSII